MDVLPTESGKVCLPMFDETPIRSNCPGYRASHAGVAVKNPPLRVKIRGFMDLIAFTLIHPPLSSLEEPLRAAMNYELIPSMKSGIELASGDPQEAAEEVMRELGRRPKYAGEIKAPEDSEALAFAARYASVFNRRLILHEKEFVEIDGEKLKDPRVSALAVSSIVYSISARLYSTLYQTSRLGSVNDVYPFPPPIVIAYGDEQSKALAAAYAAHRHLPLILAEKIPEVDLSMVLEEYEATLREGDDDLSDFVPFIKGLLPGLDTYVHMFLKEHLPLWIVYFSPEPTVHGFLSDPSSRPAFLGSFVPEFRIPTDDLEDALRRIEFGLRIRRRGELLVIRLADEPDLTAYVPSAPRAKLAEEQKIELLNLYKAHLKIPDEFSQGLDALEELIYIKPLRISAEEIKKLFRNATIRVFEGPYRDEIETDSGKAKLKPEKALVVLSSEVDRRPPMNVAPVHEIPISVARRYAGFFVSKFLMSYNVPAAMAGANAALYRSILSQFPMSKRKAFLMHVLGMTFQGIGEPTIVAHKKDPIRIVDNLSILLNAAIDDDLVRLNKRVREAWREFGKRISKSS